MLLLKPNAHTGLEKFYVNAKSNQFRFMYLVNVIILVNLSYLGMQFRVGDKCTGDHFVALRIFVFLNLFQTMVITGARNRRRVLEKQKEGHS